MELMCYWAGVHRSPLDFFTQPSRMENGSGRSLENRGRNALGRGVYVSFVKQKYLTGPGDRWHGSVGDILKKSLTATFY